MILIDKGCHDESDNRVKMTPETVETKQYLLAIMTPGSPSFFFILVSFSTFLIYKNHIHALLVNMHVVKEKN